MVMTRSVARLRAASAERVTAGEITRAVRASSWPGGPINEGDYLGISRSGIEVVAPTIDEATTGLLAKLLTDNKSVRTGEVLWTGVVAQDPDSATVIIATTGTVANNQTGNQPKAENYRLQLQLVLEKGKWLTSDLQFVA